MNEKIYAIGLNLLNRFNLKYDNIPKPCIEDIISHTCTEKLPQKIDMLKCNKWNVCLFISRTEKEEYKIIHDIDYYIYKSIDNACKRHLTKKSINKNLLSIDDIDIPETVNNLQEQITQEQQIIDLLLLIDELSEKDQCFIRWWMMKHKTKEEVAKEWSIKPDSVYVTAKRALERLKELYHKK